MKALSLTQPWASLVAVGAKRIETRSWRTSYRGPLAIHAAKLRSRTLRMVPGEREGSTGADPSQGRFELMGVELMAKRTAPMDAGITWGGDIEFGPFDEKGLTQMEKALETMASGRGQTVEQFCADSRTSHMVAYRLAACVPGLIAEIRQLRSR